MYEFLLDISVTKFIETSNRKNDPSFKIQFGDNFRTDADPSALAKYVVALVKKDKPEQELRNICNDQLDVFLQKGMPYTEIRYNV